jgi:histidinol dehydrogenase
MLTPIDWTAASPEARTQALARPSAASQAEAASAEIIAAIRRGGDQSVRDYARKLDGFAPEDFRASPEALREALESVDPEDRATMEAAVSAVKRFHAQQGYRDYSVETWPGLTAQRRATPIETVALYVPAGGAPLVSTLIMLAVPALIAGCERIIVLTPPNGGQGANDSVLAAARLLGLDEVYALGGAHGIAAAAFGLCGLPRVDKIFGPGNAYVAAAKAQLSRDPDGPAIDLPAGPSEVMVIADETADPELVAADLLSQAEHDALAQCVLVAIGEGVRDRIAFETERLLATLPRAEIARAALANSPAMLCQTREEAVAIADAYAPEHLILQVEEPELMADRVRHAGSIFIGPWTPEAAGDYAAGPNHTLPTGGAARAYGGVTVEAFQKTTTLLSATADGARAIAPAVERLAALEGLEAHALAMRLRREKAGGARDAPAGRSARRRRKTAETDISVWVNLDADGPVRISTGVGYFDHMLEQIARHGGIALSVEADGDLHIDAHHTIEDVCLALGKTLREALGDKRGIARFGFELPMDEARAGVWIDLSGRPFAKFEGEIPGDSVGGFPVEMTAHCFRSLAESLGAAVHVKVEGENAHHMIEGCFKAFGRALRQAVRIEGSALPSTKEMLA